jgi:hypothetical protein
MRKWLRSIAARTPAPAAPGCRTYTDEAVVPVGPAEPAGHGHAADTGRDQAEKTARG